MSFVIYDLIFLVIFAVVVIIFFYKNKKNVSREMKVAFLYRSQLGVKIIDYIGTKYKKTLKALKYPIIVVGYFLMAGIVYLMIRAAWIYVSNPVLVTSVVKAPPIAPVIPYFPKIFGLESFFPPLYFTYFIIAIGMVAIVHEFSHGIYMRYNKVRIKSTGVLFLGPLLGAFVEQDDKAMNKLPKSDQMSILGAGVFANVILGILFLLIWWMLFYVSFAPNGAIFNDYILGNTSVSSVNYIGGVKISDHTNNGLLFLLENNNFTNNLTLETINGKVEFTKINANDGDYYIPVNSLKDQLLHNESEIYMYKDLPAIESGLKGTIVKADSKEIKTHNDLVEFLDGKKPGDSIRLETIFNDENLKYQITLAENPDDSKKPLLGISNYRSSRLNTAEAMAFFRNPYTDYKISNEFFSFIYYLVFWICFLNLAVAFFNMLPASILDGGRFFYLTIWGITGKEKVAKKAYKFAGIIILGIFILIMVSWVIGITA